MSRESKLLLLKEVQETRENKPLIQKYKLYVTASPCDSNGEELYCICRKPDDGELMVACDGCDEWFHFKCMKLNKKYDKLVSNFYCIFCDELFQKGKTLWKRKCRLESCLNPIAVDVDTGKVSKYCSEEHGKLFIRQNLLEKLANDSLMTKGQFARVMVEVHDFDSFVKLGDVLPSSDLSQLPSNVQDKIKTLENQIRDINETQIALQSQKAYLNNSKEKLKIFNDEIFKINNNNEDGENEKDKETSKKNSKKSKKKKRKDICGYDYSNNETAEPWRNLQDLKISEQEFIDAYNLSQIEEGTTEIFQTCIRDKTKCFKHSYWYEIKLDNLQNLINENNEMKLQLESKIKNLVAMGWDFLENV